MGLRDVGEALPPGFRFYPSDEELVCHYLYKKIANEELVRGTLVEIDLHVCEPWQLPDVAKLNSNEWYFFSFRDRKYATGYRTNRATTSGYWKATGKDRSVLDPETRAVVGMRKTLVFYRNRAPNGIKTGWIMHEFRLENPHLPPKEDWVLCRVFYKSRSSVGSENGNPLMISPQDLYIPSCPNLGAYSPPNNQHNNSTTTPPLDHYFHHCQGQNPSNTTDVWAIEYPAKYLHDDMNGPHSKLQASADTKSEYTEDDYGLFMLDFNGSIGVPSTIQDMEFDDDIAAC